MPLSDKQLNDVCLLYNNDDTTCRYLCEDASKINVWHCAKKRPQEKNKIDLRVKEFLRDCAKKGEDPKDYGHAISDNCSGYPVLKVIQQGYDCDD